MKRIALATFVALVSLAFASSASAFGNLDWGQILDDLHDIDLGDKEFEWPDYEPDEEKCWLFCDDEKPEIEWPEDKECWICPPRGDGPSGAIPEPTAALLFAGGALVIAAKRRRNQ